MLRAHFVALYAHIVDHSRVVLSVPDGWGSDYINASYINVRPTVDSEQTVCHVHYVTCTYVSVFIHFCSCLITQGEHGDIYIASQGMYTTITDNVE